MRLDMATDHEGHVASVNLVATVEEMAEVESPIAPSQAQPDKWLACRKWFAAVPAVRAARVHQVCGIKTGTRDACATKTPKGRETFHGLFS